MALDAGRVPVLAPSQWLREADPLPHSWDVTSDSIAAWVAGAVGARELVLVKPAGAAGADTVDPYFSRVLCRPASRRQFFRPISCPRSLHRCARARFSPPGGS